MSQPFLSRKQLWLLISLLPGVILLLTLLGPMPSEPELKISEDRRLYQLRESRDNYQLQLVLPLPAPDTAELWLANRLLPKWLEQQLQIPSTQQWLQQQGWQIRVISSETEWQLFVEMPSPPDASTLDTLFSYIGATETSDWAQLVNANIAERYLRLQSAEEAALSALQPGPIPENWQVNPAALLEPWLNHERWQLILLTPEFLPLEIATPKTPGTGLATSQAITPLPSASPAGMGVLHHWRWPAPDSLSALARTQLALECIQNRLTQMNQGNFRLRWRTWEQGGDLDLLLHQRELQEKELLSCPEAAEFSQLRQSLLERWQAYLDDNPAGGVHLLARNRLVADSLDDMITQLEQVERSDVQLFLQQQAGSDTYRRLIFPPATEDSNAPSQ